MLPTREKQDKKYREIESKRIQDNCITYSKIAKEYAKWYATEIIKHCAEVAKCTIPEEFDMGEELPYEVDKQSILNVIDEL